ncbi:MULTISPECIES: M48 family metalloprotease [unclassified Paraflavitalea]|uniref:M48 family metalloprotease n=1 Tax=unclassified Paraflavitalea TaxID=2798305 RepID=UPI003D33245D
MFLKAIPYHVQVRDYFKEQEVSWEFFSKAQTQEEQLKEFKSALLKNTYLFTEEGEPMLFAQLGKAKSALELEALPVYIYQAPYTDEFNASIAYLEKEAHLVFSGPVLKLLSDQELLAVLAHELSHIKLYTMLEGELEVADRIVTAIANNRYSNNAHYETARLFKLFTEIFCDRGALLVTQNADAVVASLVKITTGLDNVHAPSYRQQTETILNSEQGLKSEGLSHPENFIRCKALDWWIEDEATADKKIAELLEKQTTLDQMDIFKQKSLSELTKKVLQLFLKPKWFQSVSVLAQARQYFPTYQSDEKAVLSIELVDTIKGFDKSIQQYLSYVLLDFVRLDPNLEEIPAGWAFQFSEDLGLQEHYEKILKKEFKWSEKALQQNKKKQLAAYYQVKEGAADQIYED